MALAANHTLMEQKVYAYSPSIGTTPIVAYTIAPFRCKVVAVKSVINGAITVANSSCAITIAGTAITGSPHLIVQSGSAAGQVDTTSFTGANIANEGDYISITPSGATGTTITGLFVFTVVPA